MHRATAMRNYRWKPIREQVKLWYERQQLALLELPAVQLAATFGATTAVAHARTLIIKLRYQTRVEFILCISPMEKRANLTNIRKEFGASTAWIATMGEVVSRTQSLPGCVPAFGSLFGLPVVIDVSLLKDPFMFAPSGRPGHAVCIPLNAFVGIERPRLLDFASHEPLGHGESLPVESA
ncbi:MAG: YbaK/EbsC family protein [Gemmatimonadaceae bacterium]